MNDGYITFGDGTTQSLADGFPDFSNLSIGISFDGWYQASTNGFVIQKLVGSYMNSSATYIGMNIAYQYTAIAISGADTNFNTWGQWVGFFIRKGYWYYITSVGEGTGWAGNAAFEYSDLRFLPAAT